MSAVTTEEYQAYQLVDGADMSPIEPDIAAILSHGDSKPGQGAASALGRIRKTNSVSRLRRGQQRRRNDKVDVEHWGAAMQKRDQHGQALREYWERVLGGESFSMSSSMPTPTVKPVGEPTNMPTPFPGVSTAFLGSTVGAPIPVGNPEDCATLCNNGCSSKWYEVAGDGGRIRASTCSVETKFDTRIIVWAGSCRALQCIGK